MPRCLYDFVAVDEGELSITVGEMVTVVAAGGSSPHEGWVFVRKNDGNMGFVPKDYLSGANEEGNLKPSSSAAVPNGSYSGPTASPVTESRESLPAVPHLQYSNDPTFKDINTGSYGSRGYSSLSGPISAPFTTSAISTSESNKSSPKQQVGSIQPLTPGKDKFSSIAHKVAAVNAMASKPDITASKGSLSAALEKDDFAELKRRNDEYFGRLFNNQADTYTALTDMVENLSKILNQSSKSSQDLVQNLNKLDETIDEERRRWKQQIESEKNADLLSKSRGITASVAALASQAK